MLYPDRYVHSYKWTHWYIGLDISIWLYLMTSRGTVTEVAVTGFLLCPFYFIPPFLPDPTKNPQGKYYQFQN
jgi:hypothetical protein